MNEDLLRKKHTSTEEEREIVKITWEEIELTKRDMERVLDIRKQLEKGEALTGAQRTQLSRTIRPHIRKALEYLTFMAKMLPAQQQKQVFTVENLKDFIEGILTNFERKKGKGIVENERVFHIAFMLAHKGINCGSDLVVYPAPYISRPFQIIYPEKARLLNFIDEVLRIKAHTT